MRFCGIKLRAGTLHRVRDVAELVRDLADLALDLMCPCDEGHGGRFRAIGATDDERLEHDGRAAA